MAFTKGSPNTKKGGRPKKVDEERVTTKALAAIVEKYGSLEAGFKALLESKEPMLIKFAFEHAAGKPREKMDVDVNKEVETVQIIQLPSNNRSVTKQERLN